MPTPPTQANAKSSSQNVQILVPEDTKESKQRMATGSSFPNNSQLQKPLLNPEDQRRSPSIDESGKRSTNYDTTDQRIGFEYGMNPRYNPMMITVLIVGTHSIRLLCRRLLLILSSSRRGGVDDWHCPPRALWCDGQCPACGGHLHDCPVHHPVLDPDHLDLLVEEGRLLDDIR